MSRKNVTRAVNDMVDFMKTKVTSNLIESDLDLDQVTMQKMSGIIDLSISQAFSLAYGSVETALNTFESDLKKASSSSSKKTSRR